MRQPPEVFYSLTPTEREAFWAEAEAMKLIKIKR
jgi:hypothetical protein